MPACARRRETQERRTYGIMPTETREERGELTAHSKSWVTLWAEVDVILTRDKIFLNVPN